MLTQWAPDIARVGQRSSLKHYSLHSFPALIVAPGIIFQPLNREYEVKSCLIPQ
jgi:hypothetical protein